MKRHRYTLAVITACLLAILIVPLTKTSQPVHITPAPDTTAFKNDVLLGNLLQSAKERREARLAAVPTEQQHLLRKPITIDRAAIRLFLSARRNFAQPVITNRPEPTAPIFNSTVAIQQRNARLEARKQQQQQAQETLHASAPVEAAELTNPVSSSNFELTEQGKVFIDKLGLAAPWLKPSDDLYGDWGNLELAQQHAMNLGVTDYIGPLATNPGELGNKFIIGHSSAPNQVTAASGRGDFFSEIAKLEIGDLMRVQQNGKEYIYQIYASDIIEPTDTEILQPQTEEDRLTLITCWPIGTTDQRTYRHARLISEQTYTVDAS